MKPTETTGVFRENDKIFTENPKACRGIKVYNEKLVIREGKEFRSWNPYRSKLAAALLKGLVVEKIKEDSKVLYLGAATGTTVSHVSDIVKNGVVFSVENSPVAMKSLLKVCEKRQNVIPILADANHPDRYSSLVQSVDLVYQDISQRNQAEIFIENIRRYLKRKGVGVLMVKARSIDVSLKPSEAYEIVAEELKKQGLELLKKLDLTPYEKDHLAVMVTF